MTRHIKSGVKSHFCIFLDSCYNKLPFDNKFISMWCPYVSIATMWVCLVSRPQKTFVMWYERGNHQPHLDSRISLLPLKLPRAAAWFYTGKNACFSVNHLGKCSWKSFKTMFKIKNFLVLFKDQEEKIFINWFLSFGFFPLSTFLSEDEETL